MLNASWPPGRCESPARTRRKRVHQAKDETVMVDYQYSSRIRVILQFYLFDFLMKQCAVELHI